MAGRWSTYEGGASLRREGLYSSQVPEWRRLRDAGVLEGKKAGESIGKLSKDQAEISMFVPPIGG